MDTNRAVFGLRDVGRALTRHKKKAICAFLLTIVAAIVAVAIVPKSFHSEGMLLIRLGKENATLDPTVTMGQETVIAVPTSRENELNTVVEILKSRAIAEKVVEALGADYILCKASDTEEQPGQLKQLARDALTEVKQWVHRVDGAVTLTDQQRAVEELMSRYSVSLAKHSDLVQVECRGPSPEWAQKVVDQLMTAYQAEHYRLNRPSRSVEFFAEQTDRAQHDLRKKQEALRDVKTAGSIVSLAEQRQAFTLQMSHLDEELQQVQAARTVSETRIQSMRTQLDALPAEQVESVVTGFGNEGTDQMRSQLYQLEIRREEAAAKYTHDHPAMQAIHEQVEASRNVASNQEPTRTHITKGQSRLYQDVHSALLQEETQLAATRAKQTVLGEQLASMRGEMKKINEEDLLIACMERDIGVNEGAYRRFASGFEQAKIDQARELQQISNIAVAQSATCEPSVVYPKKATFLGIGALCGILAGIAVALLAEARDRSFREPEDVERRLGVTVLATIPHFAGRQLSTSGQRRV